MATAWRIGEATRLRARTAQCSLWTIHLHEHHPMSISPTEPVPEARPATLERAVEEHDAESLWRAVSAVRAADAPEARLGLDGMPVTVRCRVADSHVERELWSVRRDDVDRPVVEHVLALIRASGDDRLTLVADRAATYLSWANAKRRGPSQEVDPAVTRDASDLPRGADESDLANQIWRIRCRSRG